MTNGPPARSASPTRSTRPARAGPRAAAVPWIFAAATVAVQIPYPLTYGSARAALAVASVVVFFVSSTTHALITRGRPWTTGFLVVAVGGGLLAETIGVHTGRPFGRYVYASSLGPLVGGVPIVVPMAWAMMAYPAYVLASRHRRGTAGIAAVGGLILATWDLFLDPQMVTAGHWRWLGNGPEINGIPLTNAAGWIIVGIAMIALLARLPDPTRAAPGDDRAPLTLLAWTYGSSVVANLIFFDRPGVAVVGGLAMGAVLALAVTPPRVDRPQPPRAATPRR